MAEKMVQKHITLTKTTVDILDELISSKVGVNNYSEAIRYTILSFGENSNDGNVEKKLNAVSKNIDVLLEMTGGGFHELGVKAIGNVDDTFIYMDAKKNVENKIQRSTTVKSNLKKSNLTEEKISSLNNNEENIKPKSRFTI